MTATTVRDYILTELYKDSDLDTTSDHGRGAVDQVARRVEDAIYRDPSPVPAFLSDDGELLYDTDYLDRMLVVATLHFLSTAVLP